MCERKFTVATHQISSTKAVLVAVSKKGELGLASNYQGISLTCTAAKVCIKLLLRRIRHHVDPLLWKNQNDFCPGRSTVAQILLHLGN